MSSLRSSHWQNRIILLLLAASSLLSCVELQGQVVVIANSRVQATEISKAELRDLFTGAISSFKDGSQVTPVLLRSGAVNDQMLEIYVGKSESAFRASWRSLLFSGQGVVPKTCDSEAAVVEYVAHTAGAIGYIGAATAHSGVKVLAVK